jgi:hypothetical protein
VPFLWGKASAFGIKNDLTHAAYCPTSGGRLQVFAVNR